MLSGRDRGRMRRLTQSVLPIFNQFAQYRHLIIVPSGAKVGVAVREQAFIRRRTYDEPIMEVGRHNMQCIAQASKLIEVSEVSRLG